MRHAETVFHVRHTTTNNPMVQTFKVFSRTSKDYHTVFKDKQFMKNSTSEMLD